MARYSSLRASDADRDAVAERLRSAAVEGRLEPDELEERLHAALRARTYGDLRGLLADLPGTPVARQRRGADVAPVARFALVAATRVLVVLAVIAVVLVVAASIAAMAVICAVAWLCLRAARGCHGRHGRNAAWHRPPHVRRV
jgi:Flp pilus assembly protein TadB